MRSRAVILPLACCFSTARSEPACTASYPPPRSAILPAVVWMSGTSSVIGGPPCSASAMLQGNGTPCLALCGRGHGVPGRLSTLSAWPTTATGVTAKLARGRRCPNRSAPTSGCSATLLGQVLRRVRRQDALLDDVERLRAAAIASRPRTRRWVTTPPPRPSSWCRVDAGPRRRRSPARSPSTSTWPTSPRSTTGSATLRAGDRADTRWPAPSPRRSRTSPASPGTTRPSELLDGLEFRPVLTAHPTEARRRAVVTAILRISALLSDRDDPRLGTSERRRARSGCCWRRSTCCGGRRQLRVDQARTRSTRSAPRWRRSTRPVPRRAADLPARSTTALAGGAAVVRGRRRRRAYLRLRQLDRRRPRRQPVRHRADHP